MKGQKIVFIIPGFGHKISGKGYTELSLLLRKEKYRPIRVAIPWNKSTIIDNASFFIKKYKEKITMFKKENNEIYLLGFSYGALIAFLVATKISIKGLFLCSLSPFFKEDLPKQLSIHATPLQTKRFEHFSLLSSRDLSKKIKAKNIIMLYGAKESKPLIARVIKTFKQIPSTNKYLLSVLRTDHNIADKKYISAIHYATKTFI